MGNEYVNSWLKDLYDTSYILESIANQLSKIRNECSSLVSNEIKHFIQEREGKLVRLFSKILYLKLYYDSTTTNPTENLAAFGTIELWLNVANVGASKAKVVRNEVSDMADLLQHSESDLEILCDRCGISGDEKRRFVKATRNLRMYTKRWLEDKREPKDEFPDSMLSWISYDSTPTQRSPRLPRNETDRRSVSESGVDSGASDSGIGSNVSQTSLPTTTPPPSPGIFGVSTVIQPSATTTVSSLSLRINRTGVQPVQLTLRGITPPATPSYAASGGQTPQFAKKSNKSPSTPPPSLKWGTQAASSCTQMIRSKSHESNLQHRLVRGADAAPAGVAQSNVPPLTAPIESSVNGGYRQHFELPYSATGIVGRPSTSSSSIANDNQSQTHNHQHHHHNHISNVTPSHSSTSLISPDNPSASDISPKSPSNLASPFSADTLSVPKSPVSTQVRMDHKIRHRFKRMWQPSMEHCQHCGKSIGLSGAWCTECKIRVHTSCKDLIGENCGWTTAQMRQIYEHFINSRGAHKRSPTSYGLNSLDTSPYSMSLSSSYSIGHLSAYGPDSASSSSCNSSAPSTPAPGFLQPSPSLNSTLKSKFTFPDPGRQNEVSLPFIHVDESDSNELRMSQSSGDATIHSSHEGSVVGLTTSDNKLSPADNDVTNSIDSNDSNQSQKEHTWSRHLWNMSTIRGASSSWREWTIPFEELQFAKPESLLGRGRFGEVHRAYWHQDVAVKILNMNHIEDDRQLEAFKQEVSTFRNTRHENLVLFVGCCLNSPRLGIVMNYCKGRTLYTYIHLRRDRLDMNKIISLAIQISQGMSYLHGKKIIHKDLRTKNVFVENNNRAVITDFSLFSVRRLCRSQTPDSEVKGLHVPEHWLCYMAPEIIRTLKIFHTIDEMQEPCFTELTDVYAFGTVWYELLTYEFPYKRQPTEAVVWQCGRGIKPALNNLPVAKEIKDILMQCWSFKPTDRPDFNQLLKTFEKLPRKRLERSPSQPVHLSRSAESVF